MQYKHLKMHLHWHVGRHLSRRQKIRLAGASLGLFTVVIASSMILNHQLGYLVSPQAKTLLSKSSVDLKKIKQTETSYVFNKQEAESKDPLKKLTVAGTTDATGKLPFQAELPKDAKDGISFKDQSGELAVKLTPQFESSAGRLTDEGHVIYPASQNEQHVYTFKRNGLKEDILLKESPGNTATYSWQIDAKGLDAKLLSNGSVGFYSTNPLLYGDITASTPSDQALVDKARDKGKKDHLAFIIPTPYIKDAKGAEHYDKVKFELKDNVLTLTASGLDKQNYPISIDPSIAVTTTNDFQSGTDDGMIDYSDPDQITRSAISTGALGASVQQGTVIYQRYNHTSVVSGGYVYVVGGYDGGSYLDMIESCPINPDGSLGSCDQVGTLPSARGNHASVVYGNVLYVIGGIDEGGAMNDIIYCPLSDDGTLPYDCTQQTNVISARYGHNAVAYNGYIYFGGGTDNSTYLSDITRCPVKADGSVGTCVSQASKSLATVDGSMVIYNGYIYTIGGETAPTFSSNSIQYCPINSDGSLGTCVFQNGIFANSRYGHTSVATNGYLYVIGGRQDGGYINDIQYCPINANGSVGTCTTQSGASGDISNHSSFVSNGYIYILGGDTSFGSTQTAYRLPILFRGPASAAVQQTSAFTSARDNHSSIVYNGYLYIIGGQSTASATGCNASGYCNDIQYCPLSSNGSVGTCTQQTAAFTTPRASHASVTHKGYLYIIGGYDGTNRLDDIQYCPLNSNGSVGTCTQQTAAFTTARSDHSAVVNGDYLYIVGGLGTTRMNDIQYCHFSFSGGSVLACTQQTNKFTTARSNHTSVVYKGYLYIIGGYNGSVPLNDIIYCPLDGSVGTCTQQASLLANGRREHASIASNGYLYIIGGTSTSSAAGCDATGYCNDIQYCPVLSDGSVDEVAGCTQQTSAFTTNRQGHAAVTNNGHVYISGGTNGTRQSDIQRIFIGSNFTSLGSVGTSTQQTSMINAYDSQAAVVYKGSIYISGGHGGDIDNGYYWTNAITRCPLNADGSSGTCTQVGSFTNNRSGHSSVAYNGYLYIIGGQGDNIVQFSTYNIYNDIQRCPINSDGSIGTCIQQTNAFTTARSGHTSVVHNGFLYIVGGNSGTGNLSGCDANANCSDIQRCQISSADGSIGTCTQQTSAFTTGRSSHTSVVYNDYLYIIGGYSAGSGGDKNDIQYCPFNANNSIGTCTQQASAFTTARSGHTTVAYNGFLYIIGGGTSYASDIQYCPINASGSIGTCTQQTSAFTSGRARHTSVVYNGYLYIMGGEIGVETPIGDIQRLRTNAPSYASRYERVLDTGSSSPDILLDSITINGLSACGYTISYATAGIDGIFGTTTYVNSESSSVNVDLGDVAKRYVRVSVQMKDDICGGKSQINDVTLSFATPPPDAPVLLSPGNAAYGNSTLPVFQMRARVPTEGFVRYKIDICSNSDCSSIIQSADQTTSQTGWSGQDEDGNSSYTGSSIDGDSVTATYTYQAPALSLATQYWWRAYAVDYNNNPTWSSASPIQSFYTQKTPDPPVLVEPATGQTGTPFLPNFRLRSADQDSDYLRYKIEICTTSNCSSVLRTIDQTSSQTGWGSQSQQSGTAYSSSGTAGSSQLAIHTYQPTALSPNTLYWWRAYAIDPGGTNIWSSASSIGTFTTINPATSQTKSITGGTVIRGGTSIGN